ncbi:DEAD/DEAH box helicase [Saccharomonospora sp. NPDC046836]|uniref:DEAD/DEAH box helicase n=1 Tax=Saccharomonospora sp. NPDC046836 TaxID=3156921 RepID=UPI0034089816
MTVSVPAAEPDVDISAYLTLLSRLKQSHGVDSGRSALVDQAVEVWSKPGFDKFLALPSLPFEPFDYQRSAAQTVLRRMRGRAILADEVGLGKTIEAGLVLSELRMRGLADRVLVLTPAGLVGQWREELERKFALPTSIVTAGAAEPASDNPVQLASIAAARREPLRSKLIDHQWDVVIADEAHRLRNPRSASGRLVRGIRTRYLLLLTATPVENKLSDLHELVSLVAPGLLGTSAQFRATHGGASAGLSGPRNVSELRARMRDVMVRHRRSEVALMLPQRLAETVLVTPSEGEAELYAGIMRQVREAGRDANPARRLTLRGLTRLAGSSPAAVAPTLDKLGWTELAERARAIRAPAKVRVLVETVRRHVDSGEQVLVFTGFRKTLDLLTSETDRAGLPAVVYDGSLSRREKDAVIARFRDGVPVLLSTESAGEGRNLQFCHAMVNVDLPWNPMQIEQRLGRLHRVGQKHDVTLTNLVARGSIEQRILHVLEAKINLFELVVGELDMILGKVDDEFDFEAEVFDAFLSAADDGEFERRLTELGDALTAARSDYLRSRQTVDGLVGRTNE